MDKVAYYKNEIYKTASRAWKAHIGDIGEEGIRKLHSAGIFNSRKELDGLKKGTENIVNYYGGIIDSSRNGKYLKKAMKDTTQNIGKQTLNNIAPNFNGKYVVENLKLNPQSMPGKVVGKTVDAAKNVVGRRAGNASYKVNKLMMNGNKKFVTVPNFDNSIGGVIGKGDAFKKRGPISKLIFKNNDPFGTLDSTVTNKFDKEYLNAILQRHEADELRVANKKIRQGKFTELIPGVKVPGDNGVYSHIDPEVLLRESANVAIAPKSVREAMEKLRDDKAVGKMFGETEKDFLKNKYMLDYGRSGVYKSLTRK